MDSIRGALNSFAGGQTNTNNNNQTQGQSHEYFRPQGESSSSYQQQPQTTGTNQGGGNSFFSSMTSKLNTAAGGGPESEKNEDLLDKGVDFVQEKFLGQGPQDNESAVEQAKDEQISDFIRGQYKSATGKDFPVKDKETRFG